MEAVTAQMTIFYRGQVLVFDDLPAEKAREIITVATKGSSSVSNGFVSTPASIMEKVRSRSPMASESNVVAAYERNTTTKERVQQQPRAIGSGNCLVSCEYFKRKMFSTFKSFVY